MKEQESSAQSGQLKADSMAVCKVTLFYWNHEKTSLFIWLYENKVVTLSRGHDMA